ncbi:MAG: hypothetical protein ACJ8D6_11415 [Sphingomicrobium sp.]
MMRRSLAALALLSGCSSAAPESDLQYIKQARSIAAEWALVNEQANEGRLTATYVDSMHQWLNDGLRTAATSLSAPESRYAGEMKALLAEPPGASPGELRAHAEALKRIEDQLESA